MPQRALIELTSTQRDVFRRVQAIVDHGCESIPTAWLERRELARTLLAQVVDAWFSADLASPGDYPREIAAINQRAGWKASELLQRYEFDKANRTRLPPKFFGGGSELEEEFVLSISLNHKLPPATASARSLHLFTQESSEFDRARMADACWSYFDRSYAYSKFFVPRAHVLRAYAVTSGNFEMRKLDPAHDFREINARFALYLELYPTWSPSFGDCVPLDSFVLRLNDLVRRIVREVLQPRVLLLAGRASWMCSDAPQGERVNFGTGKFADVVQHGGLGVVRTNFLRTVHGPNSNAELAALGNLMARERNEPIGKRPLATAEKEEVAP